MPTSAQARTLLETYSAEAGLLPTRTTASPGVTPVFFRKFSTRSRHSCRMLAATSLPSMTFATMKYLLKSDLGSGLPYEGANNNINDLAPFEKSFPPYRPRVVRHARSGGVVVAVARLRFVLFLSIADNQALQTFTEQEQQKAETRGAQGDRVLTHASRDAEPRGQPDGRRRREAGDLVRRLAPEDDARAEETDAGQDALDHAADRIRPTVALHRDDDQRGAEAHQREGAKPRGLASKLAIEPDGGPAHEGHEKSQQLVEIR